MQLLTIKQVSEKTGFAVKTLYKWVAANKIPHLQIHGNLRFDEEKLEAWLSKKEVRVKAA